MSERVTWESCPNCQRLAAVGWLDGNPVELDCPNGCRLPRSQVASAFSTLPMTAFRQQALLPDAVSDLGGSPQARGSVRSPS